mgnify:CR=1 FL=1
MPRPKEGRGSLEDGCSACCTTGVELAVGLALAETSGVGEGLGLASTTVN